MRTGLTVSPHGSEESMRAQKSHWTRLWVSVSTCGSVSPLLLAPHPLTTTFSGTIVTVTTRLPIPNTAIAVVRHGHSSRASCLRGAGQRLGCPIRSGSGDGPTSSAAQGGPPHRASEPRSMNKALHKLGSPGHPSPDSGPPPSPPGAPFGGPGPPRH